MNPDQVNPLFCAPGPPQVKKRGDGGGNSKQSIAGKGLYCRNSLMIQCFFFVGVRVRRRNLAGPGCRNCVLECSSKSSIYNLQESLSGATIIKAAPNPPDQTHGLRS